MRQIVIRRYGGPEVLAATDVPDPQPGPGEVRVRVRAAGVNFADILARIGLYPDAPRPPLVVGYEVCGTIDAIGDGLPGQTVGMARPVSTRRALADVGTITPPGTIGAVGDRVVAMTRFGGYADCVCVPARFVFPAPAHLSDAEAAAIPVNYLTAFVALYRLANLAPGETVLVHGAAGGVGIAATQLARLRRATIIGTASGAKHDALRAFGVAHPIDYHHTRVTDEVTRLTDGRGVDVILDPLGGRSFAESYRMLAPLGRLVVYGVSNVAPRARRQWLSVARTLIQMPRFSPLSLMNRNRGVFGLNLAHLWSESRALTGVMDMLLGEFAEGRLQPVVARTFPLDRAADAHRFIEERANIGKVVLTT